MTKRSDLLPKTHAKSVFCLADKDIEDLQAVEKRNPRSRNGPPMKLYSREQLEAVAHRKWGGPEGLAAEQHRREARRAARASTAATAAAPAAAAIAGPSPAAGPQPAAPVASPYGRPAPAPAPTPSNVAWLDLPPLILERIRQVLSLSLPRFTVTVDPPTSGPAGGQSRGGAGAGSEGPAEGAAGTATNADISTGGLAPVAQAVTCSAAAGGAGERRGGLRQLWAAWAGSARPGQAAAKAVEAAADVAEDADVEMVDLVESSEDDEAGGQVDGGSGRTGPRAAGAAEVAAVGTAVGGPGAVGALGKRRRQQSGEGDDAIVILSSSDEDEEEEQEDGGGTSDGDEGEGMAGDGRVRQVGCEQQVGCEHEVTVGNRAWAADREAGAGDRVNDETSSELQHHQRQPQHPQNRRVEGGCREAQPSEPDRRGLQPVLEPVAGPQDGSPAGEYVLYWMKTAVRGHENPALDVARAAAERLRLPLVVAAFVLPACQPHVNHRRVKFLLEGLRDAQRELRDQRLDLLVHVDGLSNGTSPPYTTAAEARSAGGSDGGTAGGGEGACGGPVPSGKCPWQRDRDGVLRPEGPAWDALMETARRAALIVTEDMPVDPDAALLAALVRQLKMDDTAPAIAAADAFASGSGGGGSAGGGGSNTGPAPRPVAQLPGVWAVDTACVVPMCLVGQAYGKAYAYRSATEGLRRQRLRSVYGTTTAVSTRPAGPLAQYLATSAAGGGTAAGATSRMEVDPRGDDGGGGEARAEEAAAETMTAATRVAVGEGGGGHAAAGAGTAAAPCLAWASVDLQRPGLELGALAAAVPGVDQSVRGVHLLGGSKAGYARWDAWRRGGGVGRYAATRNDAMQRCGTSRMSAYLHWGMVSPFRIAREAAASGGSGSGKFLDELVVWRELSYSFCFHKYPLLESLSVLPRWAQDTLAAHASDPRVIKTQQQLEDGATGDAFWDAAQRQLATHGELHNNVRMTWGKALLAWCPSPQRALEMTLHLNHRYALDGCDPASYGGILWCFGLFDGPKAPATTPITGTLRVRPTGAHARRLNPATYVALPP